jgi:signal transduction histidine kinase
VIEAPLRVLLVDDSPDDALLVARELERARGKNNVYTRRVDTEDDLRAALVNEAWDLILSDSAMPEFSGLAAFGVVQEIGLDVPFIIVSGTVGEEMAVEMMRRGVHDYILKDNLTRLSAAVERELREADVRRRKLQLERQLQVAQRMESLGRLAGGIAHDFNNMLTVIESYAHLVQEQLGEVHAAAEDIQVIRDAARRAAGLTRRLLAFSRRQMLELVPTDLNVIVADVRKLMGRVIGEDIELAFEPQDGLWKTLVDVGEVEQVLMNLLVNARDALPRGGRITIATENVTLDPDQARGRPGAKPGPHVRLTVADTGSGMDEETVSRIFEPFFTTKEEGRGTGLGLAMVYGIVTQCGGHITVESTPGQGSRFDIYFPRAEDVSPRRRSSTFRPPEDEGSATVLLAEDDESLCQAMRRILSDAGYTVLAAGNGEEALRMAASHDGTIHIVVTDVVMPGMSGGELAKRLERDRPGIRVLYISGYAEDPVIGEAIAIPDADFLRKPFSPDELRHKVLKALRPS